MTKTDEEHLNLLKIFHYVLAGFGYLFSFFPLIYVVLGGLMASGKLDGKGKPPPAELGWIFITIGIAGTIAGLVASTCLLYAGRSLGARTRWLYCLVVAVIGCVMCSPLGTVLGVFTIIVLLRPQVKTAFGQPA